jgi:hypothetical protein
VSRLHFSKSFAHNKLFGITATNQSINDKRRTMDGYVGKNGINPTCPINILCGNTWTKTGECIMSVIQLEIEDQLIQEIGTKAVKEFIENQLGR